MIQEKLQMARIKLQNKNLKKSGKNNYSGFTYYELADFLPTVNQIFLDLSLFSNFSIKENEAFLTVTDWEDKTQEIFTSPIEDLELKGCTKIQALGGVHTYMKRYLYLNALEIVEADMLDAKAGTIEEKPTKKKEPIKKEKNDKLTLEKAVATLKETTDKKAAFDYFQEAVKMLDEKAAFRAEYQKYYNSL